MRILPITLVLTATCVALTAKVPGPPPSLGQLPAWFEADPAGAHYISRSADVTLKVDGQGAVVATPAGQTRVAFAGARTAKLEALDRLEGKTNYLLGRDRAKWRLGVEQWGRVAARGVYPGVDVVYYPNGKSLEYDFVVAPGADARALRLRFSEKAKLNGAGELEFASGWKQKAPVAYQETAGVRTVVESRFEMAANGEVGFRLGEYDRTKALVIDPVISWSAYIGGDKVDVINGVAAEGDGSYWITGTMNSGGLAWGDKTPYQTDIDSGTDMFLARIGPNSKGDWKIAYFTYIGGSGDDTALAVTKLGNKVAIAGSTTGEDFPVAGNAYQTGTGGATDAVLVVFDPTDATYPLFYATYYGGEGVEVPKCIAAREDGRVVIAGTTKVGTLPGVSVGATYQPSNRGGTDGWLAYFNIYASTAANTFVYGTFFGGNSSDLINAVALDQRGRVVMTGMTMSSDLPLAGASYQSEQQSIGDAFVAILDVTKPTWEALIYASYFGGTGLDAATGLALDWQGRVWITGYTASEDLPVTPGAYQLAPNGSYDGFVALLDPAKAGADFVVYTSYFGGSQGDVPYAAAVDPVSGNVVIAGYTLSDDLRVKNMENYAAPAQGVPQSFVASFNATGQGEDGLVWSTLYGGSGQDILTSVTVDKFGRVFAGGYTTSADLPVIGGYNYKPSGAGITTGFYLRITQ